MDQPLDARSDLQECAIVGHHHYLALHMVAHLEVRVEGIPRVRRKLLQAEGNALLLVVEVEDHDIELLIDVHHLVRVRYASPRQVRDVHQTVHTAQVDEDAVRGDVLDRTLEHLALLQSRDDLALLLFQLGLDEGLVRNHHVAVFLVDLDDLELHRFADEHIVIADRLHIDLRARKEGVDTVDVYDHAALCPSAHIALEHLVALESVRDAFPRAGRAGLLVREDQLTLPVFLILNVDFHLIADLEIGVVAEFRHGHDAVRFVADVDHHFALVHRCDGAHHYFLVLHGSQCLVVRLDEFVPIDVRC